MTLSGDHLELTGSDLDLTISTSITVSGVNDGQIVIPAKLATDIVKSLPAGAVTIEDENETATIGSGRSEFSVHLLPSAEFPHVHQLSAEESAVQSVVLDSAKFLEGTVVEWQSSLMQSGFVFKNPNVKGSCGCGESFSV